MIFTTQMTNFFPQRNMMSTPFKLKYSILNKVFDKVYKQDLTMFFF